MSERIPHQSQLTRRRLLTTGGAVLLGAAISACARHPVPVNANNSNSPRITSDPLDLSRLPNGPLRGFPWRYELNPQVPKYNHEAEVYTNDHATIRDGKLTIQAVRTGKGSYQSSLVDTMNRWGFTHGTITAKAKFPKGVGTWPALWLLPDERDTPAILAKRHINDTPNSDLYYAWGGEIDFAETVGFMKPVSNNITVHTHKSIESGSDGMASKIIAVPDGEEAFHEYSVTKKPGHITFGLDGKTVFGIERQHGDTLAEWPFDDYRYYFIANLAMGGSWGGQMKHEYPPLGIDNSQAPWDFEIAELHYQPL